MDFPFWFETSPVSRVDDLGGNESMSLGVFPAQTVGCLAAGCDTKQAPDMGIGHMGGGSSLGEGTRFLAGFK